MLSQLESPSASWTAILHQRKRPGVQSFVSFPIHPPDFYSSTRNDSGWVSPAAAPSNKFELSNIFLYCTWFAKYVLARVFQHFRSGRPDGLCLVGMKNWGRSVYTNWRSASVDCFLRLRVLEDVFFFAIYVELSPPWTGQLCEALAWSSPGFDVR